MMEPIEARRVGKIGIVIDDTVYASPELAPHTGDIVTFHRPEGPLPEALEVAVQSSSQALQGGPGCCSHSGSPLRVFRIPGGKA